MGRLKEWASKKYIKIKIERLINITGLIQVYIELNRGKWISTNGTLSFIKPWNL